MLPFPTSQNPPRLEDNAQAPLGDHPTYDDVLDVAVQYTFPCSDPIAVDGCCAAAEAHAQDRCAERQPGEGGGHGEAVAL